MQSQFLDESSSNATLVSEPSIRNESPSQKRNIAHHKKRLRGNRREFRAVARVRVHGLETSLNTFNGEKGRVNRASGRDDSVVVALERSETTQLIRDDLSRIAAAALGII